MNSLLLILACFAQADATSVDVAIKLKDGESLVGRIQAVWKFRASFGVADIDRDQLSSIRFGETTTVTTADGTVLKGRFEFDSLTVNHNGQQTSVKTSELSSLNVIQQAEPIPKTITNGRSGNGMTYHLRVPGEWKPENRYPAIVIFHGSNMNSRSYVNTIVAAWPKIAERYILIGINGERRNKNSDPKNPSFNYSYVNFVGKRSRFKGYPGTDRESPALVKEVVEELKSMLKIDRLFVGGHSQGGYLTYSVFMNFPELFDGAFPVSSGMIVQAAPDAFDKEDICKAQRSRPIAIVHSSADNVVGFGMSRTAYGAFKEEGFSRVRLFDDEQAGHRFAMLPVNKAIEWLEQMSSRDPKLLIESSESAIEAGEFSDALALLERAAGFDGADAQQIDLLTKSINSSAGEIANKLLPAIEQNKDGTWVEQFLKFRNDFAFAKTAQPVIKAFDELHKQHQPKADQIYEQSKKDYKAGKIDEAYAKYQQVVDQYYASSWYSKMKRWIADRKK